ncbi:MAG TPA: hypothetical protein VGX25_02475 [Actinophytocola sp.]|uniref:hypothetical protein n=1 Tax=Actinophytocola sp. TaxID=1872138 RepID=UPI002DDD734F|nr:hypothetical protein [Actinophytocola sp.]HEV2778244.1 hypothetical protein [Actinophytocola sp.]
MGLNFGVTGVLYNKTLAERIGMTAPPATLAEFDELLAKPKQARRHDRHPGPATVLSRIGCAAAVSPTWPTTSAAGSALWAHSASPSTSTRRRTASPRRHLDRQRQRPVQRSRLTGIAT